MSSALGDLATALVSRLPTLLEQATAHETASGFLFDECVQLEARVALVRESIELERKKQSIVKAQLARLRVEPPREGESSCGLVAQSIIKRPSSELFYNSLWRNTQEVQIYRGKCRVSCHAVVV